MRGFSLHQPWAWALVHRDKVENRPMRAAKSMIGQRIAIQAAKKWDDAAIPFMESAGIEIPEARAELHTFGAVIGVATLVGYVDSDVDLTLAQKRWFVGPYGYLFEDRQPLQTPVPCRGMQGFFPLTEEVEKAVLRQLEPPRAYDSSLPPGVKVPPNLSSATLPMVVIYDRPHDAPIGFTVRLWHVSSDGIIAPGKLLGHGFPTLEAARASVPGGMVNIGRMDADDAKIVETWI